MPQRLCLNRFHLSDITIAEAEQLPYPMLLALLEIADPPTDVTQNTGTKMWETRRGYPHRGYDLPAMVYSDGSLYWYRRGKLHRGDGKPAVIHADGSRSWWVNHKKQAPPA